MHDQRPLSEVELYHFTSSRTQFLLTPHEFDVDLGGDCYRSRPIERSALALGVEAARSALELRLSPDEDLVRYLLGATVTGEATAVSLRIGQRDELWDYWWLSGTRWMGRVLGVDISRDGARIRCESAQVSLERIGLRRLYSRQCSYVLYSRACGAVPISAGAVVAEVSGRYLYLEDDVPARVSGGLAGGWLQTPEGMRHMILADVGNRVELLYPVPMVPGTRIELTVGCDHSALVCEHRFNNLDNYGGFPAIPKTNPFSTSAF